jgi:hypothetical protein
MHGTILRALLSVILATSALAEPIQGIDDPAFRAPFERALQGDDLTALKDLHAAAEAGNQAAILALPFVSDWLRAAVPFAERTKLFYINDQPMPEAFAAADPIAALWNEADPGPDMDALLNRAFALYTVGEADKATGLFMTWLNQTGGYHTLPKDFFDHPVPPWAMAFVLRGRLADLHYSPPVEANALLAERLKADDPAAWIALAAFAGLHRAAGVEPDTARLAAILGAAGIPQDEAARRMQQTVPVLLALYRTDTALSRETAEAAAAAFKSEPEFEPLVATCAAACPASQEACVTAFVAGFGHPYGRATMAQPLASLISTEDFFATPRGRMILLRSTQGQLGDDPTTSPALAAAREIDECLADAILTVLP